MRGQTTSGDEARGGETHGLPRPHDGGEDLSRGEAVSRAGRDAIGAAQPVGQRALRGGRVREGQRALWWRDELLEEHPRQAVGVGTPPAPGAGGFV